jgi:hypothetical protein
MGALFELAADTHQTYGKTNALHPYLPGKYSFNPVIRELFDLDREKYWMSRAHAEKNKRAKNISCR